MQKPKRPFLIARTLMLTFVAAVLGVSLYSWNAKSVLGNQMPMPFGYGVSVILSGSMEPELSVNDLVIIRENKNPQVGDVAVYQDGGMMVIHRIIGEEGDSWIFQGDANNTPDSPVSREAVKGTLALTIPGVGSVIHMLQKPAVIAVLLAAALLMTESSYRKEKKTGSEELEDIQKEIQILMQELKENKE